MNRHVKESPMEFTQISHKSVVDISAARVEEPLATTIVDVDCSSMEKSVIMLIVCTVKSSRRQISNEAVSRTSASHSVMEFMLMRAQKTANHMWNASMEKRRDIDAHRRQSSIQKKVLVCLTRSTTAQNQQNLKSFVEIVPMDFTLIQDSVVDFISSAHKDILFSLMSVRKVKCLIFIGKFAHISRQLHALTRHTHMSARILNKDITRIELWILRVETFLPAIMVERLHLHVSMAMYSMVKFAWAIALSHVQIKTQIHVTPKRTATTRTSISIVDPISIVRRIGNIHSYARMVKLSMAINVYQNESRVINSLIVSISQMDTTRIRIQDVRNISFVSREIKFRWVEILNILLNMFNIVRNSSLISPQTLRCDAGKVYNGYSCVQPSSYACPSIGHSQALKLNCVQRRCHSTCSRDGFFADYDSRCQNYHFCVSGKQTKLSCSPGYVFNENDGVCVAQEWYQCPVYCSAECSWFWNYETFDIHRYIFLIH